MPGVGAESETSPNMLRFEVEHRTGLLERESLLWLPRAHPRPCAL